MAGQTITLQEALREMGKGEPFDITYCKCDVKRGIAGEFKTLTRVVDNGKGKNTGADEARLIYDPKAAKKDQLKTVHIRLITEFNGKRVL